MPKVNARKSKTKVPFSADAVRTYLHEIGRVPLLTHEEEIILGKQVQRMMELLELREALQADQEQELTYEEWAAAASIAIDELKQILRQGERSKRKMIEANLRLVVAIA
ncbi:MAG: sigma-70 factor domain-containing protein, partial [Cyanobacteria bacterium P01_C01_bin.70]